MRAVHGPGKAEGVSEDPSEPLAEAPEVAFEAWALRLQLLAELRALAGDEPDDPERPRSHPSSL